MPNAPLLTLPGPRMPWVASLSSVLFKQTCCPRSPCWEDTAYVKDEGGGETSSDLHRAARGLLARPAHHWASGTRHRMWREARGFWKLNISPPSPTSRWATQLAQRHATRMSAMLGSSQQAKPKVAGQQGHCWPRGTTEEEEAGQSLRQTPAS